MNNRIVDYLYSNEVLWQMNPAERAFVYYVHDKLAREGCTSLALEIGSYKGGFTTVLSDMFKQVISIDIDHSALLVKELANLILVTGDSKVMISTVLAKHNPDFILVDGDHSYEGVLADLEAIASSLQICAKPVILVHDSAYTPSNKAILEFQSKYTDTFVVYPEIVPGVTFGDGKIGGFALIFKK